jgi:hypothetical protein
MEILDREIFDMEIFLWEPESPSPSQIPHQGRRRQIV